MTVARDDEGDGAPLVLVHGLATTRMIWRRVTPLLREGRRIVAVDVPGFGDSPPVGDGFELGAVAAAIAHALPDEPFDLVGHSLGGAVALTLAAAHPGRVRRLVLAAPAGLNPFAPALGRAFGRGAEVAIPLRRRAAGLADVAWGRRILTTPGVIDPDAIPPLEIRAMLAASGGATRIAPALAAAASADLRPKLASLPLPVGAIWGDGDRIVRPGGVDTIRALRPEAPVVTIPRTGHIPMMEQPHAFAAALEQVLSRLGNTRVPSAA